MSIFEVFKKNKEQVVENPTSKDPKASFLESREPLRSQKLWAALRSESPEVYKAIQEIADIRPDLKPYAGSTTQYELTGEGYREPKISLAYNDTKKTWDMFNHSWTPIGSDHKAAQAILDAARSQGFIKITEGSLGLAGEVRPRIVRGDFDFPPIPAPETQPDIPPNKSGQVLRLTADNI
jgi:hypothetical protein